MQIRLAELSGRADVAAAVDYLHREDESTLATQIALSEIPAPPFQEARRAERLAELLDTTCAGRVERDATGNVIGRRSGVVDAPPMVVAAHLDTVFPGDVDVRVTRDGPVLRGPGISDDARGLAALVALSRALDAGDVRTRSPLLFVGTVGEEGPGDLRGVKQLFAENGHARAAGAFVSLDGAGLERIVAEGLGSRRYRITLDGPGGHSWVDFGTPNPAHALVALGSRLSGLPLGTEPKTTLTIARVGGGKSINAIPQSAWMEIDLRGAKAAALASLVREVERAVGVERERQPDLNIRMEMIGDRPGGATDPDCDLVRAAVAATLKVAKEPRMALSSTDANIPMTLGIPAITIGCGGEAGKAHTTDEWYRNTDGPAGIERALYTLLLTVGLEDA
ncbi:MAG: M20/M25/M40 family metallo-hydrolase [Gemmatimonadota bacterium]|nr:M20/M25/M40 family metallo-hydrolase [Gemmatimonadota bacterium]MDH3424607.1 M20/M25/M40 family metallo-hydrolase [Gemmatimonadota bacterium]